MEEITQLLLKWRAGDALLSNGYYPLVYNELRRLARQCMRKERAVIHCQTTGLVNEAVPVQ